MSYGRPGSKGRDEILDQIERLNRQHGLTIILVSHSMEDWPGMWTV